MGRVMTFADKLRILVGEFERNSISAEPIQDASVPHPFLPVSPNPPLEIIPACPPQLDVSPTNTVSSRKRRLPAIIGASPEKASKRKAILCAILIGLYESLYQLYHSFTLNSHLYRLDYRAHR